MNLPYAESSGSSTSKILPPILAQRVAIVKHYIPRIMYERRQIVIKVKIEVLDTLQSSGVWDTKIHIAASPSIIPDKLSDFRKEKQAFYSMRDKLKKDYAGKYVAIYGEQVVGSDFDKIALAERFYNEYGEVPVYIGKPDKDEPIEELLSPL
jgi:hypothetical protein